VFLIEPIVNYWRFKIKNIEGEFVFRTKSARARVFRGIHKNCKNDLSEVHAGCAGNAPILGAYLATIILNKDATTFQNENWKHMPILLVDSAALKRSIASLFLYILRWWYLVRDGV